MKQSEVWAGTGRNALQLSLQQHGVAEKIGIFLPNMEVLELNGKHFETISVYKEPTLETKLKI